MCMVKSTRPKRFLFLWLVWAFLLYLTACSVNQVAETSTPILPTNTPVPTLTPAPTNTRPAAQTPTQALMATDTPVVETPTPVVDMNVLRQQVRGTLLYGDAISGNIATGMVEVWQFSGKSGDVIDVTVEPIDELDVAVDIFNKTGQSIIGGTYDESFDTERIPTLTIPANGDFLIVISGFQRSSGDYRLSIVAEGGVAAATVNGRLAYGETIASVVTGVEAGSTWRFEGTIGDVVDIVVEPTDSLDVVVDVLNSNGRSILSNVVDDTFGTEVIQSLVLPASDDYSIVTKGFGQLTGAYNLTLTLTTAKNAGIATLLNYGDIVTATIDGPEETAVWTFIGRQGDIIDITGEPITDEFDLTLTLSGDVDIAEEVIDRSYNIEFIRAIELHSNGEYRIVVSGFEGSVGKYELRLNQTNKGDVEHIIVGSNTIDEADEGQKFAFTATQASNVTAIVGPSSEFDIVIEVYNADTATLIAEADSITSGFEELTVTVPEAGNYYFWLRGFEAEDVGAYDIRLVGPASVLFEVTTAYTVTGRFQATDTLIYQFQGQTSDDIALTVHPDSNTDVALKIQDSEQMTLAEVNAGTTGQVETLHYSFTKNETIEIVVSSLQGKTSTFFTLNITED